MGGLALLECKGDVDVCREGRSGQGKMGTGQEGLTGSVPLILRHVALPLLVHDLHADEQLLEFLLLALLEDLAEWLFVDRK